MAKQPTIAGLRFKMTNPSAEKKIAKSVGKLITGLKKEVEETVRDTVLEGFKRGLHPNAIALDIVGRIGPSGKRQGGIVGMSKPQAEAARNLRARLESGEPEELSKVLGMKLRDKRFDGTIKKAIEEARETGSPVVLSEEKIDRMVDRYVDASLQLRGETIARTETMAAVNSSSLESFEQVLERTEFSEKAVTRTWRTSGGANVRDSHAEMEGQTVEGLDEPFISGLGNELMQPGDTSLGAGAEDVVNCACDVEIDMDFTENLED